MDCLKDYIGVRHCTQGEPESGLYINNLPGISTELADRIASSEQVNFLGVWEDVQARSFARFSQDVQTYLFEYQKVGLNRTILQTKKLVKPRNYEILDKEAIYRGVYVFLPISRFIKLDLKYVQLFVKDVDGGAFDAGYDSGYEIDSSDLNASIKIFDLHDEKLVAEIPYKLGPGLNNIPINLEFDTEMNAIELFIAIDSSKITSIKTWDNLYSWYDGECPRYNGNGVGFFEDIPSIYPALMGLSDLPVYDSLTWPGIGQGLAIDAQVSCSVDQFVCDNKKYLKTALMYLLGAEMLAEKLGSNLGSRVNWFTYGNLEQTELTRLSLESKYVSCIKNAVRSLQIPDSGLCFDCNENAQSFEGGSIA